MVARNENLSRPVAISVSRGAPEVLCVWGLVVSAKRGQQGPTVINISFPDRSSNVVKQALFFGAKIAKNWLVAPYDH